MNTFIKLAMLAPLVAYACGDSSTDSCTDQDPEQLFVQASTRQANLADWRVRLDSIVATAPADSIVRWGIFMPPQAKARVRAWADSANVEITYEFRGFSAFAVDGSIRSLSTVKELDEVTGIEFNTVSFVAGCS